MINTPSPTYGTGTSFRVPFVTSSTEVIMQRLSLLLVVGTLLIAISDLAPAQNVPELLYYKFEEAGGTATANLANLGVGTNPAPLVGQTMGGTGQFGSALVGTGATSNYVETGWTTNLSNGSWTISMWLNNLPNNTTLYYLCGDVTASSFRSFLGGAAGAGNVTLRATGLTDMIVTAVAPGPTVVTYVYDGPTQTLKSYKNGVLFGTRPSTVLNINGTGATPYRVGAYSTLTGLPAGGLMDEFRLYNRALDDAEVAATWNQSLPLGTPGWSSQTSGVATALNTVKAVSSTVAWAAGNGGVVLRTTDGGTTWTSVGGGAIGTAPLYNIEALNANIAFTTTTPTTTTYIFRTTNGGATWDTVFTQSGGFINAIHMFDATTGIAQGDPLGGTWMVLRTTDGGTTWARITTEPTQVGGEFGANNGMKVLGTTHIWWTPGTGNGFYRSTDGGATWTRVTLPASGFTAGINFLDTQYGVVGNNAGAASRTTDGGATWTVVTIGTTGPIYAVGTAGTLDFWVTRGTTIQTSNNRGATWAPDFSDATAGTFNHANFVTTGGFANGWAVTSTGKIYAYFNPVNIHDLGVSSLAKVFSTNVPPRPDNRIQVDPLSQETWQETGTVSESDPDQAGANQSTTFIIPNGPGSLVFVDTVGFRAVVTNFGTLSESGYQLGWQVDGVNQTPINGGAIAPGANDTLTFQWNEAVTGVHILRAWTTVANDGNASNDTASLSFSVGRVPGDTLYTFVVPNQIILGVAKMGPSAKLAFTSGGQVSGTTTTDNKWIITDLYGTILDTTFLQINPTAGQGFGFRDLAWDGRWLLTGDDTRLRRIDTTTFTELLPPVITQTNPVRGIAVQDPNRIWIANFTTNPLRVYDTTGAIIRNVGTPTVAPYGLGWDTWTDPDRAWLWYPQPSLAGQNRLSKVDTATGAIVQTFNYSAMVPATFTVGGFDIINDHPDYPGAVLGFMVIQGFPASRVFAIYLGEDSTVVGVGEYTSGIPTEFALMQNYPNPFNPTTRIEYGLPEQAEVTIAIHNLLGQEVTTLYKGTQSAGFHSVDWNGQSLSSASVSSGVYFYSMRATANNSNSFATFKKMLLLK